MKSLLVRLGVILIGLAIFGLVLGFVFSANAEVRFGDYYMAKNLEWFKFYISGVGSGFGWANVQLHARGLPPLYCQPDKLGLNADNLLKILDDYIEQKKDQLKPDLPVEMLLLQGLKETFPCNR
jgi:hypothetical protein